MQQIPAHSHPLLASADTGDPTSPGGNLPAQVRCSDTPYIDDVARHASMSAARCRLTSAAASRTPTSSRTCASTSSSRCSASSRRRPDKEARSWPIHLSPKSASSRSTSRPRGWAFCDGQILPLSPEHGALLAARHDLRRRRQVATSPCRTCRGARRCIPARDRAFASRPGRDRRLRDGDACSNPRSPRTPMRCGRCGRPCRRAGAHSGGGAGRVHRGQRSISVERRRTGAPMPAKRWPRPAAMRRTTT